MSSGDTIRLIQQMERRIAKLEAQLVRPRFSGARVYNSANISIPNNVGTSLTFNSERFDTDSYHSISVNTDRLTVPMDGNYLIAGNVRFVNNASGIRGCTFLLNDTDVIALNFAETVTGNATVLHLSTIYQMSAGDYVSFRAYQNSGGSLNVEVANSYSPEFMIAKLG